MKSKSLKIKILSGMLSAGIAFSSASLTFASVKDNSIGNKEVATSINFKNSAKNKKAAKAHHAQMEGTLKIVIKESIASKIITQDEGDKVLKYVTAKSEKNSINHKKHKTCKRGKCDGTKGGLFNDLVTEGILTKEKSDVLREKMYVKRTEIKTLDLKNGLNTLVVNKVITIEQSNKVQIVITARHAERKEMYKKMKNMSEKDREAYMKTIKDTKVSPMKVLIDNGTITKEQGSAIQKILPQHNHGHHGNNKNK